jgi:hypothetical protein
VADHPAGISDTRSQQDVFAFDFPVAGRFFVFKIPDGGGATK